MSESIKGFLKGVVVALAMLVMGSAIMLVGFAIYGFAGAGVAVVLAFVVAMGLVGATSS